MTVLYPEPTRQTKSGRDRSRLDVGWPGLAMHVVRQAVQDNDRAFLRSPLGGACAELLNIDDTEALIQRAEESAEAH